MPETLNHDHPGKVAGTNIEAAVRKDVQSMVAIANQAAILMSK